MQCTKQKDHGPLCQVFVIGMNVSALVHWSSQSLVFTQTAIKRKHKKAYCKDELWTWSANLEGKTGKLHFRMNYSAMVQHPCMQLALSEQQSKSLNHKEVIGSYSHAYPSILPLHVLTYTSSQQNNIYKQNTHQKQTAKQQYMTY